MKEYLVDVSEVREGGSLEMDFFGRPITITRQDGDVRAFANVCVHLGGPLTLEDGSYVCGWHGACFDARTGKATAGPVAPSARLMRLPVRIEDGKLFYVYGEQG